MPTESTYPTIDIPGLDLWDFLFNRKDKAFPDDKVIYRDPETSRFYTYAQTRDAAITFGRGLRAQWRWKKGDVLALYTPNCIDTPAVTWGLHWAGGILTPANPGYTVDELAFQLHDSKASAIVTQKPFLKQACAAARKAGISETRVILMGDERDETGRFKHFTDIRCTRGMSRYRKCKIDPKKDLAFLVYSSGTTGLPKGVMLSHENIVANTMMNQVGEGKNLSWTGGFNNGGDKILAFIPFFHIYGLTCLIHHSLYSGLELVVMAKFDLDRFCLHVQTHKITYTYAVPPVILMLGKSPVVDKYDLSSLRMLKSGAAPLTKDLTDAVYRRLGIPIKQGYGLSETSPTTHTQRWEDWHVHIGSVGRLLPNQTAKYIDDFEIEVPFGETGELCIKGPNVFQGYLNNPGSTKNAFTRDGYFKTGDVGHQDTEGNFYITDRVKELIKYKGFQVPPAELEGILLGNEDVEDVAVIGIYEEERATEVPRAYIVPKASLPPSPESATRISDWLTARVANHKRLRGGVRFVSEIPKSTSGKILRRVLKDSHAKEIESAWDEVAQ
ncbi:acetyl-CoA synthetase-like protein [Lophium mytilinum]|uniref:Acetyl-CoA synthetase-like protein n=1 Tax=Lophium mytilinum TaxID=390894 RepID=A0A6A6R072_9PEZI|nr:acetyl-CoA synthetase-like protein [Lophium mytilinum]